MEYTIHQMDSLSEWENVEYISVNNYPWGGSYRPNVTAKAILVRGQYFAVRMECEESSPRAVYTENNSNIYEDSCMECFINFKPLLEGSGYINLEANANGALFSGYGECSIDRVLLCDRNLIEPPVTALVYPNRWSCDFIIPLSLIEQIYGNARFETGDILKGNFFKCGDKTETAHYATWAPNGNPSPAFHMPQNFGKLIIG